MKLSKDQAELYDKITDPNYTWEGSEKLAFETLLGTLLQACGFNISYSELEDLFQIKPNESIKNPVYLSISLSFYCLSIFFTLFKDCGTSLDNSQKSNWSESVVSQVSEKLLSRLVARSKIPLENRSKILTPEFKELLSTSFSESLKVQLQAESDSSSLHALMGLFYIKEEASITPDQRSTEETKLAIKNKGGRVIGRVHAGLEIEIFKSLFPIIESYFGKKKKSQPDRIKASRLFNKRMSVIYSGYDFNTGPAYQILMLVSLLFMFLPSIVAYYYSGVNLACLMLIAHSAYRSTMGTPPYISIPMIPYHNELQRLNERQKELLSNSIIERQNMQCESYSLEESDEAQLAMTLCEEKADSSVQDEWFQRPYFRFIPINYMKLGKILRGKQAASTPASPKTVATSIATHQKNLDKLLYEQNRFLFFDGSYRAVIKIEPEKIKPGKKTKEHYDTIRNMQGSPSRFLCLDGKQEKDGLIKLKQNAHMNTALRMFCRRTSDFKLEERTYPLYTAEVIERGNSAHR